jgi:hypothetical protein
MARTPEVYSWDFSSLSKVSRGVAKTATGDFTIADLIELSGIPDNTLRQFQVRGEWDPADVTTIVPFLARRGRIEFRKKLVLLVIYKPEGTRPSPPKTLAKLVEWLAKYGTPAYRARVFLAALGTERKKRRKKAKRVAKSRP